MALPRGQYCLLANGLAFRGAIPAGVAPFGALIIGELAEVEGHLIESKGLPKGLEH